MKKMALLYVVVILFCLPGFCFAQLGGVSGNKEGAASEMDALSARYIAMTDAAGKAAISFAKAVAIIQEAAGQKEHAQETRQGVARLQADITDQDKIKECIALVATGMKDIRENDRISGINVK